MARSASLSIRVVSYNVLSSHLASPSHFSTLNPDHLEAPTRLRKVLAKLEDEIRNNQDRATVFCLQEVSYDWAGAFHVFFAKKNYHVITGQYGKKFNGYMGVLTAWPIEKLEAVKIDIKRLSDTVQWPRRPEPGYLDRLRKGLLTPFRLLGLAKEEPEGHWSIAQRRFNVLLTAILKNKKSNEQICIGNYHMPCCFYAPMVMTMHADMCLHHVQFLARRNPYILAGDFNIKPTDSMYDMLVSGKIDRGDPSYPAPPPYAPEHTWEPSIREAVRSAYAVAKGSEPDFTNFARIGEQDPFVDTLDYIFVSANNIHVESILDLPHRNDADGPFPNAEEPSDHIMIAANLRVMP